MVNGVARLVKMCTHRSGLDELMVILDGTTMFAKAFHGVAGVLSLRCNGHFVFFVFIFF